MSPENNKICKINTAQCPICKDFVSGIHYGVQTCESCKSFFKRAISFDKSSTFQCLQIHNKGKCRLSPFRRNCKFCRFHKCIKAGMLPNLVRIKKERGGRAAIYVKTKLF
ncbi:hypothetical protein B5X24_HaOG216554 [Helicoverpa armigera]|uniref:Nuclear receptor domain-containing protein n=1 Tax=Helicoverpa armigera TaxID=29058 RepID=A0A2W1CJF3_HELAM|nr:hypothetical protein B5X24_HaOG216554 [Helicoverpa armigera]